MRRTLKPAKKNILTFFRHWITNTVSESLNSTIQAIKKTVMGFRNRGHFKIAVYFHCVGRNFALM
ncbi:MAG: transposase [Acidobacteriota bacterium]|nr:transposase [Acidobacteriota bacterium]